MTTKLSKTPKSSQTSPKRPVQKKQNKLGPYNLLQTLGEGEFGKVKLGVHTETGQEVAIKLIKKEGAGSDTRINKVEREIAVLKTLNHPYIVKLFNVVETEKYIGIILEYASGGELFEYILAHRYLKEKDAKRFFAQLISSVQYMHKRKIVHRDLKLENLLLDKNRNIIVTDFGFANQFDLAADDLMATTCGSPCYAAPELVVNAGLYAGSAVDIWSCGVILYAMLCGFLPFDDDPSNPDSDNINQLYRYILSTHLMFPAYVSAEARDLLQKMLVPDPAKRCSLEYIMKHSWLDTHRDFLKKDASQIKMDALNAAKSSLPMTDIENINPHLVLTNSISTTVQPTSEKFLAGENQPASRKTHIPVARDRFAPVANDKYLLVTTKTKQQNEKQTVSSSTKTGPFRHFTIGRSTATTSTTTTTKPSIHATVTPITNTTKNSKVPSFISRKPIKKDENQVAIDKKDIPNPEKSLSSPLVTEESKIPTISGFGSIRKNQRKGTDKFLSFFTGGRASHIPVVTKNDEFGIFDTVQNKTMEVICNSHTENTLQSLSNIDLVSDDNEKLRTIRSNSESSTLGDKSNTPSLCTSSGMTDSSSPLSPAVSLQQQQQQQTILKSKPAVTTNHLSRSTQVHIDTSPSSHSFNEDCTAVSPTIVGDTIEEEIEEEEDDIVNTSEFLPDEDTHSNLSDQIQAKDRGSSMRAASMVSESSMSITTSSLVSFKDAPRRTPLISSPQQQTGSSSLIMRQQKNYTNQTDHGSSILSANDQHDNASISSAGTSPQPEVSNSGKLIQKSVVSNAMGDGIKAMAAVRRSIYRKHKSQPPPQSNQPMSDTSSQTSSNYSPKEPIISFTKSRFEETGSPIISRRTEQNEHRNTWSAPSEPSGNAPAKKTGKKMMDWIKKKSHAKDAKKATLTPITTTKLSPSAQILTKSRKPGKSDTPAVISNMAVDYQHTASSSSKRHGVSIIEPARKTRISILPSPSPSPPAKPRKKEEYVQSSQRSTRAISGNEKDLVGNTVHVDERIQIHQGAIDRTALTSQPPADIIKDVKRILRILGIEAKSESTSPYLLKCSRRRALNTGDSSRNKSKSRQNQREEEEDINALDDQQFVINHSNITTSSEISLEAPSQHESISDSSSSSVGGELTTNARGLEPIYGDASIDNGDEIRFVVEVCRFQNLPGLYIIDIRRLRGNVWAYKFLYHKLIDFLNVGRDSGYVL